MSALIQPVTITPRHYGAGFVIRSQERNPPMARGHIYRRQLRDGGWSSWHAVIDVGNDSVGKRRQVTRSFRTRREAQAWLADQAQRRAYRSAGVLLGDWLMSWLPAQRHLRHSTRVTYETHVRKYLIPVLGDTRIDLLRREHLESAHDQWRDWGASEVQVKRIHSTLSSALSAAVREGLAATNAATLVRLKRQASFTATVWTAQQAATFLKHAHEGDLAALWRLALVTGLRRAELLGLRWRDIDLTQGLVTVRTTRTEVAGRMVEGEPKSHRGRRCVVIDTQTRTAMRDHHQRCVTQALAAGTWLTTDWWVFIRDAQGSALTPALVNRRFDQITREAGVPRIRFHDLRHTSASLGLASGESLKQVSARLGHSSLATTGDLYLQIPEEVARHSAQQLGDLLDQRPHQ